MTKELAQEEVNKWADGRRLSESKRKGYSDQLEAMVEAVMDGSLVIKSDNTMELNLQYPVESTHGQETHVEKESLTFSSRLRYKDVKRFLRGVKNDDAMGMVHAHICGLTKTEMAIIDSLEMVDLNTARSIATLFL
ncbi:MAG: hypothetical protein HRU26_07510 [Psychroserpens sp.]|nr:hypothetical protein [Psychroserpens sp.]